jgi:hypothetical protein
MIMPTVKILLRETYLAMIKNAVGSRQYQNCYALVDGKRIDIANGGKTACAFFATTILFRLKLIREPHMTVDGTERDLVESDWKRIRKPRLGSILVWEMKKGIGSENEHIGFFVGNGKAISMNPAKGVIDIHHWTYGELNGVAKRRVVRMYDRVF